MKEEREREGEKDRKSKGVRKREEGGRDKGRGCVLSLL